MARHHLTLVGAFEIDEVKTDAFLTKLFSARKISLAAFQTICSGFAIADQMSAYSYDDEFRCSLTNHPS